LKARPLLRIRYGTHHLLSAGDALAGDELQRGEAGRLFEDAREMERAELNQNLNRLYSSCVPI
jgi:hypothetical protein